MPSRGPWLLSCALSPLMAFIMGGGPHTQTRELAPGAGLQGVGVSQRACVRACVHVGVSNMH